MICGTNGRIRLVIGSDLLEEIEHERQNLVNLLLEIRDHHQIEVVNLIGDRQTLCGTTLAQEF